jgi:peptidoglycan/LPS O-acetylase OafA/YrhL
MANFRPELQGLRAIAVALVLGFHLVPGVVRGGFVGVDVFFVLSGFLITRLLTDEWAQRGRISIPGFLRRRARRLLPAACVVLLATVAGILLLLPAPRWGRELWHVVASTLQVENWQLSGEATNYLLLGAAGTATQQFWTLSMEWQVYIVWAVVVAVVIRFPHRVVVASAVTLFTASLVTGVVLSASMPALAYFSTMGRAWEFLLGAIVALAAGVLAIPLRVRAVLGWVGLAAIVVSGVGFTSQLSYPGLLALVPTVGSAMILVSHAPRVLALAPLVWLGDRSYAIYLWHWPLLVFAASLGLGDGIWIGLAIAGSSVAFATLTKALVEDPAKRLTLKPVLAGLLAASLVLPLGLSGAALWQLSSAVASAKEVDAPLARYPGAAAIDVANLPALPVIPDPLIAFDDLGDIGEDRECLWPAVEPVPCEFGDADATRTLVVVGDSHAWQFVPMLDRFGDENGWRVLSFARASCPFTPVPVLVDGVEDTECPAWRESVFAQLALSKPDLLVTTSLGPWGYEHAGFSASTVVAQATGYRDYWSRLAAEGIPVVAIKDTPYMGFDITSCVATTLEVAECGRDRSEVFHADPLVSATSTDSLVPLVDLTPGICRATTCPAVVGNVLVYRDAHHLTATYARTLAPMFAARLTELGY